MVNPGVTPSMAGRKGRVISILLAAVVFVSMTVTPVLAEGDDAPMVTGLPAGIVFIAGAALLVYSVEKLIGFLTKAAVGLDLSLFVLAILFTGIEFDDVVFGVATNVENLDGVALGVVFGTALSLTGITLALAAILTPFEVDVPRDYLVLFALSPFVMVPFVLSGSVTPSDGVVLIALFVLVFGYIVYRESSRNTPVFRDTEVREMLDGGVVRPAADDIPFVPDRELPGIAWLGLSVVALVGLVIGASAMSMGTEGIVTTYGIEDTVFGATVATAVLTVEDLFLTIEPVRRGAPEIGVGNVVGSVLFSVTGKIGVIALAGSIGIGSSVLVWHLPVFIVGTVLAAYFIHTGRLRPWQGYVLLGLYVAYWVVSFVVFGGAPIEM
ncbi:MULTISPECIES: sodium:proton exchanger [unclassified Haladaptatus]|uniref:sodium:calcium antiporter n=2 Tax=unclassified Haladaptatus TaxID=2622732 RepID=UPI00209C07B7|nr:MULTISPECIES: sodium:proton exchanger [unclassified Haladaptatus]MCO8244644.1 sodium:proton exchanger [Haladaptatus sp. AB643]MCO8253734.1 sodium:proton exchanger [Haladaptatus sp. AB618]